MTADDCDEFASPNPERSKGLIRLTCLRNVTGVIGLRQLVVLCSRLLFILCFLFTLRPALAADELLMKATGCGDFDSCFEVMLQATSPRKPEAISVAAARIGEFQKTEKGNRKAARDLNIRGLREFKKNNFLAASIILKQAASEDPSDVEVQSNLGLALLRANRPQDAQVALKAALAINPRRTGAWVPMAEYFFQMGLLQRATSSLLLAFEFSENREKTRSFFEEKAALADPSSAIYSTALKQLSEPRSAVGVAQVDSERSKKTKTLTKNEAKALFIEKINSDADFRANPLMKEILTCSLDDLLKDAFGGATTIDVETLERRLSTAGERMKASIENKDPDVMLKLLRCIANSSAIDQVVKEKGGQEKAPLPARTTPTVPLIDLEDLRLDMASLEGKKVRVRGVGLFMMEMFFLKQTMTDMSPIVINISKLQREQRRQLMQQCSDIMSGCRVTILGTVGKVSYQNGLMAENIEW